MRTKQYTTKGAGQKRNSESRRYPLQNYFKLLFTPTSKTYKKTNHEPKKSDSRDETRSVYSLLLSKVLQQCLQKVNKSCFSDLICIEHNENIDWKRKYTIAVGCAKFTFLRTFHLKSLSTDVFIQKGFSF